MRHADNLRADALFEQHGPCMPWLHMHELLRLALARELCEGTGVEVKEARADGQIIVHLTCDLPANVRGTLLLNIEALLKREIDGALVVWLESKGDKNPLRNLRGIEIKS